MASIFDNTANAIEKEIADYIKPLVTPEVEEKIKKEKLTLGGCWKYCYEKGRKFKVGNVSMISPEQHFKWVREYFGIKASAPMPKLTETEWPQNALCLDLDTLLD